MSDQANVPSLQLIACRTAVVAAALGTACASEPPFTLEVIVNDQSALVLSVDRGTIEPANEPFSRVFTTWNAYEDALADPGVTISNGQSSLTVGVRDCQDLDPGLNDLGTIIRQVQSIAVAADGTIRLVISAGWECSDSDGVSVGVQP